MIKFGTYKTKMGNNIKRTWKPNVHTHDLYSEILGETIKVMCTDESLKAMDQSGGLDNYIMEQKTLESPRAAQIKTALLEKMLIKEEVSDKG